MITGITLALTENSRSAETNKTNITITATITWNGGSYDGIGCPLRLKMDGVEVDYVAKVPFNTGGANSGSEAFYAYTTDIEHNANGDKILSCELIYETARQGGTRTVSASWVLTQIPRASTIAATAADIGAVSMISVNRKNSDYTHEIAFAFEGLSGYIVDADGGTGVEPVRMAETAIAFTVPDSFYGQIPNATSGECTLTCRTFAEDVQIGEEKTCKFRVTTNADECRPVVTGTVVDVNAATIALTGDENMIVLNASTALCTMNVEVKHGAAVQTRMIAGRSVEEDSLQIDNIEQQEITFSVTDSRGYTGTYTVKPSVVSYVPLTCNPVANRVDPTSGKVLLTVSGKYYWGSFGQESNTLNIRVDAAADGQIYAESIPVTFSGDSYTGQLEMEGFNYRYSYSVEITAEDGLNTIKRTATVRKGLPVFDWGENDFNFNVPVSFQGEMFTDFVVDQGTTAEGWHYRKWRSRKIELWKQVSLTAAVAEPIELGTGDAVGYYSADTVQETHGFILSEAIEMATVTGGNGCWLASIADGVSDCTNEYRLYSYEHLSETTHYINFYIFANDYD